MTRTKESITLEMKAVIRRWVLAGALWLVLTVVATGSGVLLAEALGRSSWLVNGIPWVALVGCFIAYSLLIEPVRRKYSDLKLERGNAPSETVAGIS